MHAAKRLWGKEKAPAAAAQPPPGKTAPVAPALRGAPGLRAPHWDVAVKSDTGAKLLAVSLPKAGSVWVLSLLSDALDAPAVHPSDATPAGGLCVAKCHRAFAHVRTMAEVVRIVYVMRDLRDSVVSFFHYAQSADYRTTIDPSCIFPDMESFYYEYFLARIVPWYDWEHHPDAYIQAGVPMLKYERLWDQPEAELGRLFERWNMPVAGDAIARSVARNAMGQVKAQGKSLWREMPATHFRKGGYGKYREQLPPGVLADINRRFGDYLRRWGYAPDAHAGGEPAT